MTQPLRRIASLTVMPFTLAAALGGALFAMQRGAPPTALIPPFFIARILWLTELEQTPCSGSSSTRTSNSGWGRSATHE